MSINAINSNAATPNTTLPVSTSSASNANSPGSQRDLFMTLLVAQLKNQDPLQPQDGAAFVAQLAQFNSLDQLVGIRQSLDALGTLLGHKKPLTSAVE